MHLIRAVCLYSRDFAVICLEGTLTAELLVGARLRIHKVKDVSRREINLEFLLDQGRLQDGFYLGALGLVDSSLAGGISNIEIYVEVVN